MGIVALACAGIVPASSQAALLDANCPGPTNGGTTGVEAQTFTAVHTGALVRGEMFIAKQPGSDWQMQILAAGPSGPTGPALGSTTIPDSSVANVASPAPLSPSEPIDGDFSPGVPVSAGQMYAIVVTRLGPEFWLTKDRSGDPCPGDEFTGMVGGPWMLKDPGHDYPFSTFVEPPNFFSIKSQLGRTITVTVPGPGTLSFQQAPLPPGVGLVTRGFEVFRGSTVNATSAGDVTIPILLNKTGKRQLHRRGKLSRTGQVTFMPTGGTANSLETPIKLKLKKRRRHRK